MQLPSTLSIWVNKLISQRRIHLTPMLLLVVDCLANLSQVSLEMLILQPLVSQQIVASVHLALKIKRLIFLRLFSINNKQLLLGKAITTCKQALYLEEVDLTLMDNLLASQIRLLLMRISPLLCLAISRLKEGLFLEEFKQELNLETSQTCSGHLPDQQSKSKRMDFLAWIQEITLPKRENDNYQIFKKLPV